MCGKELIIANVFIVCSNMITDLSTKSGQLGWGLSNESGRWTILSGFRHKGFGNHGQVFLLRRLLLGALCWPFYSSHWETAKHWGSNITHKEKVPSPQTKYIQEENWRKTYWEGGKQSYLQRYLNQLCSHWGAVRWSSCSTERRR